MTSRAEGPDGPTVAVIGGGAAGLMAAIAAARAGARVVLFEGNDRVGKKLVTTGNGRCNLTNLGAGPADYHGAPALVQAVLPRFTPADAVAFFEAEGLATVVEDRGRVFPRTGQASAVLDVLRFALDEAAVDVRCGTEVTAVTRTTPGFELAVSSTGDGERVTTRVTADHVVLTTGGRAAPGTGSRGQGYALARALGHAIVEPFPALVQLRAASPHLKALAGVRVEGRVTVRVTGQPPATALGEVLFTDYGLSGPAVLSASRTAAEALVHGRAVTLELSLLPDRDASTVTELLLARRRAHPTRTTQALLVGLVHKRVILPLLKDLALPADRPSAELSDPDLADLARQMTAWSLAITATTGWTGAQVTAGGIAADEVDPTTLESRKAPGLYLAGEVLDVDGDSGGYNLQWAWASGWVAGRSAGAAPPP
jgi:predicted Rossmann fold flavoprotein